MAEPGGPAMARRDLAVYHYYARVHGGSMSRTLCGLSVTANVTVSYRALPPRGRALCDDCWERMADVTPARRFDERFGWVVDNPDGTTAMAE